MTILILLLNFHFPSFAQSIEPGLWKDNSRFIVNGLTLPHGEQEECITKEQAKDVRTAITKDLKKIGCLISKWKTKGSSIEASLNCKTDEIEASGVVKGNFTKKSYELNGEAEGSIKEVLPATATVRLRGQWMGACSK